MAKIKTVKCRSGLSGWQGRLRDNYDNDFEKFVAYCEIYGVHKSLGYKTPATAWRANPVIQGSTHPDDFCRVVNGKRKFCKK